MTTTVAAVHSGLHPKYVASDILGAGITELCGYLYAATYRLLVLIQTFDAEGYWQLPGLCSCAHWLNFKCGIGMNAAREKVRVARALPDNFYYDADGWLVFKARFPADQGAVVLKALERAMERCFRAEIAYLEHGPHVSAETSRRIACDGGIVALRENQDGVPLSIGRKSRAIPPAIRRALQARDGGCRFPGCTRTRFVDGHHIRHWADGGETSLDNLVLLCRHHHRLVHEGGFHCERGDTGRVVFLAPTGDNLSAQRQATSISKHDDVMRWFDRCMPDPDITPDTCVAQWFAGDRMDWNMAVSAMFQ